MSNSLIVRQHPYEQDQLEWLQSELSDAVPEQGTFEQLASKAKGKRVIFLVPGKLLLLADAILPEGSQRTVASALPYALEERLAVDVDKLHISAAPRQSDGSTPVAVIDRQLLTNLFYSLVSVDIQPYWLLPEPLALPLNKGGWSLLFENNRVIVRMSQFSGFECALDMLRPLLIRLRFGQASESAIPQEKEHSLVLNLYGEKPDRVLVKQLEADGFMLNHYPGAGLSILTQVGSRRSAINILNGFSSGDKASGAKVNWWPAVIMFILSIAIFMGASGYQYWALLRQEQTYQTRLMSLFKASFPEVKRVVDPLQQARQQLDRRIIAQGQREDNLLNLLYRVGQALRKDQSLKFETVEFREGILQLRMKGKGVESIEHFKQQVESDQMIVVEILSTVVRESGIEARVKIRERTS